jgi:hypothetical protein
MHDVHEARPREVAAASEVKKLRRRNRWLIAVVGVLVVVSLGLAAWAILGEDGTAPLTVEQETMLETIDAYIDAWNTGDAAAADALMHPDGYLEDISNRFHVADGTHADYLKFAHSMGMRIYRGDPVALENVVVVPQGYSEGSPTDSPNVYYMSADGTRIQWLFEPYPLGNPSAEE